MNRHDETIAPALTAAVEPLLIELPTALELTGLGRSKFLTLVAQGEIPSAKIGARRLYPLSGLRAWVAAKIAATAESTQG